MSALLAQLQHQVVAIHDCMPFEKHAGNCERQWANRLTVEWRKQQFLSIWGFVRVQLAHYLDLSPEDIIFNRTSYGKPYIVNSGLNLSFNISHTKDHIALCYGKNILSCGIDIEILREMGDMLSIAQRFYAAEEFQFINQLKTNEQQKYFFFKLWVIKEALLKTLGKGLSFGLDKVFVNGFEKQQQGVLELICDDTNKKLAWQFFEEPKKKYFKAVAATVMLSKA